MNNKYSLVALLIVSVISLAIASDSNNVELIGHIGGPTYAVAVQNQYVYIGEGCSLRVLDISNPTAPIAKGSIVLPGNMILSIAVTGSYAYVADNTCGFRIININNPDSLQEVGAYDSTWNAYAVSVVGTRAYVAAGADGLRILDISNPAVPVELGYCDTPGMTLGVFVQGMYAYLADYTTGLRIIDISSDTAPQEVGFYDTSGLVYDVKVQSHYAYLACSYQGLKIIDINSTANPVEVGSYLTSGYAQKVVVRGDYAYMANDTAGLSIINISIPSAPSEIGYYRTSGNADDIAISANYVYLATRLYNLQILNINNPAIPVSAGKYEILSYPYRLAINGNYLYVVDYYKGLRIIDRSNPAAPQEIGSVPIHDFSYDVYLAGNYAYVAGNTTGLHIIDINNPNLPHEIAVQSIPGYTHGVYVQGRYAYVAAWHQGLRIIDISNPTAPYEIGVYTAASTFFNRVVVQGNYAYVSDYFYGLRIIDISSVSALQEVGNISPRYSVYYSVQDLAINGNYAYLAQATPSFSDGILNVIDISNPTAPSNIAYYYSSIKSYGISARDSFAYPIGSQLNVIDFSNPLKSVKRAYYTIPGIAYGVQVDGTYAYVGDVQCGVFIFHPEIEVVDIPDIKLLRNTAQSGVFYLNDYLKKPDEPVWNWLSKSTVANLYVYPDSKVNYLSPLSSYAGQDTVTFYASWFGSSQSILKYSSYLINRFPDVLIDNPDILKNGQIDLNQFISKDVHDPYPSLYSVNMKYTNSGDANKLFITLTDSTIEILPIVPKEIGYYNTSGNAVGIYVSGNYAYIADRSAGLRIIDISDPIIPIEVGYYDTQGDAQDVVIRDNYAYVADGSKGLRIIDISSTALPIEIGACDTSTNAVKVVLQGNYAYQVDFGRGLQVIDISDPKVPRQVAFSNLPSEARDIFVSGNYAYVANGYSGLYILDISTSTTLNLVGQFPAIWYIWSVSVRENYAYVGDVGNGLRIINVSEPSNPTYVGSCNNTSSNPHAIFVTDNYAYVVDNGVRIINIANPFAPFESGHYSISGDAQEIFVKDHYIFTANNYNGLRIVSLESADSTLLSPAEIIITAAFDTTSTGWDKQSIRIYEIADAYGSFDVSNDTSSWYFESYADGLPAGTLSWQTTYSGATGILRIQQLPGDKAKFSQVFSVPNSGWYTVKAKISSNVNDPAKQQKVYLSLFEYNSDTAIIKSTSQVIAAGNGGLASPGNWQELEISGYAAGTILGVQLVVINPNLSGVTGNVYLDHLWVYPAEPDAERYSVSKPVQIKNANFDNPEIMQDWLIESYGDSLSPGTWSYISSFSNYYGILSGHQAGGQKAKLSQIIKCPKENLNVVVSVWVYSGATTKTGTQKVYLYLYSYDSEYQKVIDGGNVVLQPGKWNQNTWTELKFGYTPVTNDNAVQLVAINPLGNPAQTIYFDNVEIEQDQDSLYYWDHTLF